ncbi:hypothetical protein ACFQV8_07885 [Pseudonocardia benzenivorans]
MTPAHPAGVTPVRRCRSVRGRVPPADDGTRDPATSVSVASTIDSQPNPLTASPIPADSAPTASPVRATATPESLRVTSRAPSAVSSTAMNADAGAISAAGGKTK